MLHSLKTNFRSRVFGLIITKLSEPLQFQNVVCLFHAFKITGIIKYIDLISTKIYEKRRYSSSLSTVMFRGTPCITWESRGFLGDLDEKLFWLAFLSKLNLTKQSCRLQIYQVRTKWKKNTFPQQRIIFLDTKKSKVAKSPLTPPPLSPLVLYITFTTISILLIFYSIIRTIVLLFAIAKNLNVVLEKCLFMLE